MINMFILFLVYFLSIVFAEKCDCSCENPQRRDRKLLTVDEILTEITFRLEQLGNETTALKESLSGVGTEIGQIRDKIVNSSVEVVGQVAEQIDETKDRVAEEFVAFGELINETASSFVNYLYIFLGCFIGLIFFYGLIKYYCCSKYYFCGKKKKVKTKSG